MTTRRKSTATATTYVQLPLLGSAAIYVRVETPQDAHPDPVETLQLYAQELGYAAEQITVYTDTGERAAAPLNKRQGYISLLQAITQGKVHILYLHAEHTIFSGADMGQVNIFIHRCIEKRLFIVTPQAIYDMQDLSHLAQFRATCLRANAQVTQLVQQTRGKG